jgi:hypothetical protein
MLPLTTGTTRRQHGVLDLLAERLALTAYGSCVDLVLYNPATKAGAVAHLPGSLGAPQHAITVGADADQILNDVVPVPVQGQWRL